MAGQREEGRDRASSGRPEPCCFAGGAMEGDCLSCMKYLMFVFNFFIFVSIPGTSPWGLPRPRLREQNRLLWEIVTMG